MRRTLAALVGAALACGIVTTATAQAGNNVAEVRTDDARVNAAMAKARKTLPRFVRSYRERKPGDYSLKYRLRTGGRIEHIWVSGLQLKGDRFVGQLANTPVYTNRLRAGSQVTFGRDEVSDWMINAPEGIYGAYTVRALVHKLPKAQADAFRARFRD